MLLDSDSSLKVAHDIIHDANELVRKWPWLLADPSNPPEGSTVSEGYVDFEYANGSVARIPCAWMIFINSDGDVRERIAFIRGEASGEWTAAHVESAGGSAFGLASSSPISLNSVTAERILALDAEDKGARASIDIVSAQAEGISTGSADVYNCSISELGSDHSVTLTDNTYGDLDIPDGEISLDDFSAEDISTNVFTYGGEQVTAVEKINAWIPQEGHNALPETDATYSGYIPFDALSGSGIPMNGFNNELISNPFYPDWIYVGGGGAPWKPTYAWVPSATIPNGPYWQDSDRIYWHRVRVSTSSSGFGSPNLIWPIRTASDSNYGESTTPPMKADAEGLVVMVKVLASGEVPVCVSDRYEFENDSTWTWSPGAVRMVKGPCICEFIARRVITRSEGKITAVEYQFLPTGDLND